MEIVSCKKLTRAGETIAFVAWVTGTGEAAQGIGTLSEHVTRSILALIFVWGGEKNLCVSLISVKKRTTQ